MVRAVLPSLVTIRPLILGYKGISLNAFYTCPGALVR
jgi:hypothetical protein